MKSSVRARKKKKAKKSNMAPTEEYNTADDDVGDEDSVMKLDSYARGAIHEIIS
jgi:hypothetical protein